MFRRSKRIAMKVLRSPRLRNPPLTPPLKNIPRNPQVHSQNRKISLSPLEPQPNPATPSHPAVLSAACRPEPPTRVTLKTSLHPAYSKTPATARAPISSTRGTPTSSLQCAQPRTLSAAAHPDKTTFFPRLR